MIFLSLSIITNTLVLFIFKLFSKFKIDTFQAIVVNYVVATLFGYFLAPKFHFSEITSSVWFPNTIILGILFITLFNILGLTAQKAGISVSSVANKMSVIIPIVFSILFYNESVTFLKLSGILLALIGVFFASWKDSKTSSNSSYVFLPIILFIGSGILDTFIEFSQNKVTSSEETKLFVPTIFASAAVLGLISLLGKSFFFKEKLSTKSLVAGVILGVCNYASIYYFVKTLGIKSIEKSIIFPINNMGIVIASSVFSFLIFKENLSKLNWLGILLSLIAIALISFGI